MANERMYAVTRTWYVLAGSLEEAHEVSWPTLPMALNVKADPCRSWPAPCECEPGHVLSPEAPIC